MAAVWRVHGLDEVMRRGLGRPGSCWPGSARERCAGSRAGRRTRSARGCGRSPAGSGCWRGSYCPHYSSEPARRPLYEELVAAGTLPPGVACDDGAAAHYVDGALATIVTEQADRHGYRVEPDGAGGVTSMTLSEELLP